MAQQPVLSYSGPALTDLVKTGSVAQGPIKTPPSDAATVKAKSDRITLTSFLASDAFNLGLLLRERLTQFAAEKPTVVHISLCNSGHVLFHAVSGSGTVPDNDVWVARKKKTVQRFGCSTWLMHCKFEGEAGGEKGFKEKYGLSDSEAAGYAIHGGGVPIYVKGVEGAVAVVVVSGLKQDEDHGVIMETFDNHWAKTA